MREDTFEILTEIKYPLDIVTRTEEEAQKGMLEGEEFMVLEIQAIGMAEKYRGKNSLAIDYIAACNQKVLTSPWMKEKIRLLSDVCENTVMVLNHRMTAKLFLQIREEKDQELCLYRLSAWCSMCDDGSQRWSIRDKIDPMFEQEDKFVSKRAEEARKLAGKAMVKKGADFFDGGVRV